MKYNLLEQDLLSISKMFPGITALHPCLFLSTVRLTPEMVNAFVVDSGDTHKLSFSAMKYMYVFSCIIHIHIFSSNACNMIRVQSERERERERDMFYLTTHSTHFIYGYMASDIWLRTILIVRKETRCRHIDYSYRLTARVLLYAPSHRQDNTYHGLCYASRGAHEGSIRRPTAP